MGFAWFHFLLLLIFFPCSYNLVSLYHFILFYSLLVINLEYLKYYSIFCIMVTENLSQKKRHHTFSMEGFYDISNIFMRNIQLFSPNLWFIFLGFSDSAYTSCLALPPLWLWREASQFFMWGESNWDKNSDENKSQIGKFWTDFHFMEVWMHTWHFSSNFFFSEIKKPWL